MGGGANSDTHQVVLTFAQPVTFTGASVTPASGKTAQVIGTSGTGTSVVTVDLGNVSNAQTITIKLAEVTGAGSTVDISVPMGVLLGDTNADRSVNSSDIGQTKSQSFHPVVQGNFREDVNVDGAINSSDIGLVKSKSFTALPP